MDRQQYLDALGQLLMDRVRDYTLRQMKSILEGRMKTPRPLFEKCQALPGEVADLPMEVALETMDHCLHNLMCMIEESEDVVKVHVIQGQEPANLEEISDGLPGELFSEYGWIARFSKYPTAY